ncbi:DUF5983 family protein [Photobacterium leiognathi]|uniref:DUF5983 family protein n=1 Tax=Photobacterium leiognathi TaxID=553611 RepID=UPI002981AC2D|nr:hypothetical protein [Photobacterium leiognathi]
MFGDDTETLSVLSLNTAHLSVNDTDYLNQLIEMYRENEMSELDVPFIEKRQSGYILELYSETDDPKLAQPFDNLFTVINSAIKKNFSYIEFDCDAKIYPSLLTYDKG